MVDAKVIGMRGETGFKEIVDHFCSLGGEVVLMDPMQVYGERHVLSAVMHAERSFEQGTNRSKTIMTEILMYTAGERQISKAMSLMRPKGNEMVAVALGCPDDLRLGEIRMEQDDSVIDGTEEKAASMGLDTMGMSLTAEELALERVAMLDLMK
jgi:KEOPS complex subunit Cgi121